MLEAIARINGGGATAGAIAAELDVAPSTVTVALKKLQQRGLVTKAQNERDARRLHVTLTHEGERINRAHALFHRKMVRDITDRLEDDELAALLSAVSKLNRYFNDRVGRKNG
jgi:DNA-binding MarR family transcriptional regulator